MAVALATAGVLTGCSAPTLDAADLEASAQRVRSSIAAERRVAFDEALRLVREASRGEVPGSEAFSVDGMDAAAVFAEAGRIDTRREIAWFEEVVEHNQTVLDTAGSLARFEVVAFEVDAAQADGRVRLGLTVHNGLPFAVESAWMTTEVELANGERTESSDYLVFRPPVAPGGGGSTEVVVTGTSGRFLPEAVEEQIHCRFTTLESRGRAVLEAVTPDMEAKARAGVEAAEAQLAELRRRLDAPP
jgi:hypothetical protein